MNAHERLERARQVSRRVTYAQQMEANLKMFESLGLDISDVEKMAQCVGLEASDLLLLSARVSISVASDSSAPPEPLNDEDLPEELTTDRAAKLLGISKDTLLKLKDAGLLEYRNAAPPTSSRPVFRFKKESVTQLRTTYQKDVPLPRQEKPQNRHSTNQRKPFKYVKYDDQ